MPAYELKISPSAKRDLERLPTTTVEGVDRRLQELIEQPRRAGSEKLTGFDLYRSRVGDHRIVCEIDDFARTVTIARIRHRREVYASSADRY